MNCPQLNTAAGCCQEEVCIAVKRECMCLYRLKATLVVPRTAAVDANIKLYGLIGIPPIRKLHSKRQVVTAALKVQIVMPLQHLRWHTIWGLPNCFMALLFFMILGAGADEAGKGAIFKVVKDGCAVCVT